MSGLKKQLYDSRVTHRAEKDAKRETDRGSQRVEVERRKTWDAFSAQHPGFDPGNPPPDDIEHYRYDGKLYGSLAADEQQQARLQHQADREEWDRLNTEYAKRLEETDKASRAKIVELKKKEHYDKTNPKKPPKKDDTSAKKASDDDSDDSSDSSSDSSSDAAPKKPVKSKHAELDLRRDAEGYVVVEEEDDDST